MYMLAMKNRTSELKALDLLCKNGVIGEGFMPLVEVIRLEKGDGDWSSAQLSCDKTLEKLNNLLPRHRVFVDFYRCDLSRFKRLDGAKCALVFRWNNDLELYSSCLRQAAAFANIVPVVAIKEGVSKLSPEELESLVSEVKSIQGSPRVAVRIEDYEGYDEVLKKVLSPDDFLIYDINETPLPSKIEEIDELESLGIEAKKILLCSPRRRTIKNSTYIDGAFIDNSHIQSYSDYGFDAVGDYAGLKDDLPGAGGGAKGCALALLYEGAGNSFRTFVNPDSSLGTRGFRSVVGDILGRRAELEGRVGECLALKMISERATGDHFGNWQTWITYTVVRYVQQLYLAHGNSYNL